jgi:hypothetical protein
VASSDIDGLLFERSTDYGAIRKLLIEPRCYSRMTGNGHASADLDVGPRAGIEYILARECGEPIAVFLLATRGGETEVHFCFAPEAWGRTKPIAIAFIDWVWANTIHTRLVGPVPSHNRLALRLAMACGFEIGGWPARPLEIRKS